MTVEALLHRKRELLAAKREETDSFSAFFIREELADINARLRALRGAPPRGGKRAGCSPERARYGEWLASERGGGTNGAARRACLAAVENAAAVLTPRQKELFDCWRAGGRVTELAERFGVNKSTVSRTLARAKARLRAAASDEEAPRTKEFTGRRENEL